jgi:hypothetical protein
MNELRAAAAPYSDSEIDKMTEEEAKAALKKCMDEEAEEAEEADDAEDDDEEEDDDDDEEPADGKAAAAGALSAVLTTGHRLYTFRADRLPDVLNAIAAAGGGYLAQTRRRGKVAAVLTDVKIDALDGVRLSPERARITDQMFCRAGATPGGAWMLAGLWVR